MYWDSFIFYLFFWGGGAITVISLICTCNFGKKKTESNLSFLSKYDLFMLFIDHTSRVSTYIPCMYVIAFGGINVQLPVL